MIIAIPVIKTKDLIVSPHFSKSSYFLFVEISDGNYKTLDLIENPYINYEYGKGRAIIGLLMSRKVNAVIVGDIGPGMFHNLVNSGIKVYYASRGKEVNDVIKAFIRGDLKEAVKASSQ